MSAVLFEYLFFDFFDGFVCAVPMVLEVFSVALVA